MNTHNQWYSLISMDIPTFLLFSNPISPFYKAQFGFKCFLGTIQFSILQSPKTNYHIQFFQSNEWLFPISQIQPFHNQNSSIWSLIHAILTN